MNFEYLETERLLLRKLTPEVYDYIFQHLNDEECMNHLGLTTTEELEKEKEKHKKGFSAYDRTFVIFQLIEKTSKKVIGMNGFVRYYPGHFRAELGYALYSDAYKNKGYMSEVIETIINYGFNTLKIERMEALVGPSNAPSLKLVKKQGFQQEALLKKHFYKNGILEDSILFSLFRNSLN